MTTPELWGLAASIVSVVLGFGAVALSVYFFVAGKRTEGAVGNSLTKIETQTEMLQKITGKQLDRLTRYVTAERPDATAEATRLLLFFTEMTKPLSSSMPNTGSDGNAAQLRAELVTCYIAIYYYTALANVWSQMYLPAAAEFDEKNQSHTLVRHVVDTSAADFTFMAGVLGKCATDALVASPLANILQEAKEHWRPNVRSTADVFIARNRPEE